MNININDRLSSIHKSFECSEKTSFSINGFLERIEIVKKCIPDDQCSSTQSSGVKCLASFYPGQRTQLLNDLLKTLEKTAENLLSSEEISSEDSLEFTTVLACLEEIVVSQTIKIELMQKLASINSAKKGNTSLMRKITREKACTLASAHFLGQGCSKDEVKAKQLYQASAQERYKTAVANIASMFSLGMGGKQDHSAAFKWYKIGAEELGDTLCMIKLALAYNLGLGVEKNGPMCIYWCKKAADLDGTEETAKPLRQLVPDADAACKWGLGFLYGQNGCRKDTEIAFSFFKYAIQLDSKHDKALYFTAMLAYLGCETIPKDEAKAFECLKRSLDRKLKALDLKLEGKIHDITPEYAYVGDMYYILSGNPVIQAHSKIRL